MANSIKLTTEYKKIIASEIPATEKLLAKEQSYRFDLQDADMVKFYKNHIEYLQMLLTQEYFIPKS
jgi:hypothetical protein